MNIFYFCTLCEVIAAYNCAQIEFEPEDVHVLRNLAEIYAITAQEADKSITHN